MERDDNRWLDEYLDHALAQYGRAEPRPGIENRILATLSAEEARAVPAYRWKWVVLAACSAVASLMLVAIHLNRQTHQQAVPANKQSVPTRTIAHDVNKTTAPDAQAQSSSLARLAPRPRRLARPRSVSTSQATELAKLSQFPSPAPLSEQERILARYVSEHREQAVMLARAQTDLLDQERREEQNPKAATAVTSPNNQR